MKEHDSRSRNNEYSLTVGRFAKLCGTTRDTLRHYYEQGILTPFVDPENGYHYYSTSQISSFYFISTMRQAGCSIKEISGMVHDASRDGLVPVINAKIADLERERRLLDKKISALKLGAWFTENYAHVKPGVPFLSEIPAISVIETPIHKRSGAYHSADIAKEISLHFSKMSAGEEFVTYPSGATIAYRDFISENYSYNNVITLSLLPPDYTRFFPLPSRRAVLCSHDHNATDIDKSYRKIAAYINRNRLKACSDLYSVSLINLYDHEKNHTYYKYLLLCVE